MYRCRPDSVEATKIPNEWISLDPVEIVDVIEIPDLLQEILRQQQAGAMEIRKFRELSPKALDWLRRAEADVIQKHNLLHTPGTYADYMKRHYPESWSLAELDVISK